MPDWQKYAGMGLELALTILIGLFSGFFIDRHFGKVPWFTLAGCFLGFTVGFYNLLNRLKGVKDNKDVQE